MARATASMDAHPVQAHSVAELAQTLFEEAGDALILFDPESEDIVDVNPMALRLSEFSRQELLRMQITYLLRSEIQGGLNRLRLAFRKTGLFHSQDGFLLRHRDDGVWVPVNLTVTRLHAALGTLGLVTARDMREQREAQALLKKTEAELQRVLASVSDGLWSAEIDASGKWTLCYCSPGVERVFGRPQQFFTGGQDHWLSVIHPDDQKCMQKCMAGHGAPVSEGGRQSEQEYRIVRPDGSFRWVRDSVTVSPRSDGGVRLDGVVSDITERKRAEDRLATQYAVTRVLAESATLAQAAPRILSTIGTRLGWDVGVVWRKETQTGMQAPTGMQAQAGIRAQGGVQGQGGVLRCVAFCHADGVAVPAFESSCRRIAFRAGVGLPGRIWAGNAPAWIGDVANDSNFPRAADAAQDGLHGAFGFPVQLNGACVGVVEFFSREIRRPDSRLLEMFAAIGSQIGQFIDRTQADEALRGSEARYRLLFERNLAGVFRSTPDGRLLDCNDSFARILGYASQQEILEQSALALYFTPRQRNDLVERLKREGHLTSFELCMRRRDSTPVWVLENVSLLQEDGQDILEGTIVDISDRKRTEEAHRASEAKYRSLIENLEQNVFLKDRHMRFVAANGNFCRSLGCSEQDIIGRTDYDFYPAHLADKYRRDDLTVLQTGRRLDLEEENLEAGKTRTVRVIKTPVKDSEGLVVGVLGIFWDVTAQLALESQLRQAQKMEAVGQLAGGVAHDFNNLLTVILGNLSFAQARHQRGEPLGDLLGNAEQAGLRAADLTQRLLGFSRRTMLRAEPFDLSHGIDEAIRFLGRTFDPRIHMEVHGAGDLWPVKADPSQINQVLVNLALNARDAMPEGGTLAFETANFTPDDDFLRAHLEARPGEFVRLSVRDTGHGMLPEIRQRIFEPFFTTKEPGKGSGLGLAMVFGIVTQHRGWIECDSTSGRGTRFDVYLPRLEQPQTPAAAADAAPPIPVAGHETILVVDDEPLIRNIAQHLLADCGYQVLFAEDGKRGVDIYRNYPTRIDLVILDGTMPKLSGRDALTQLIHIDPKVRILFSSGYSAEHHQLSEFPQVVGFLNKPYRADDLAKKVREILDKVRSTV